MSQRFPTASGSAKKPCGKHVELANNETVRVTRCPCGTVHITFVASGVTLRTSTEALRGAAAGLTSALTGVDDVPQPGTIAN